LSTPGSQTAKFGSIAGFQRHRFSGNILNGLAISRPKHCAAKHCGRQPKSAQS